MHTDNLIEQTPGERIDAAIAELGLSLTSVFVPYSKQTREPGSFGKAPFLTWKVTLLRNGREVLTTDYSTGCAHAPSYKGRKGIERDRLVAFECETGRKAARVSFEGASDRVIPMPQPNEIKPDARGAISSLVSDSDVIDCATFEEWAGNLGYDPDSRKGEATYRACLELALKMRSALGDDGLRKLREACQDY